MNEKKDEQGDEFRAWVFSFDCGEVQFTTQLVKNKIKKAAAPRRQWMVIPQRRGWLVIGAEPLIIGAGYEAADVYPATQWTPKSTALVPIPQPPGQSASWRDWRITHFIQRLRTDRNLIISTLWLIAGMAWWAWLFTGGESFAAGYGPAVERSLMTAPTVFCLLSVFYMAASIIPDFDIVIMKLQVRHWQFYGGEG